MFYLKNLFLIFISLFLVNCVGLSHVEENTITPPFWKIKKENNTAYILRIGSGIVPITKLKCSKQIEDSLKKSKQLLTEENFEKADKVEKRLDKYFSGSIEDKKTVSEDDLKLMFSYLVPSNLISDKNAKFENLSEKTQQFIKKQGFYNENKTYADYYRDIYIQYVWDFYSQFQSSMVSQLLKIANDNKINVQSLVDSHSKEQAQGNPTLTVTADLLNQLVNSQKAMELSHKLIYNKLVSDYKNWEKAMKKYKKKQKPFGEVQLSKDSPLLKNLKNGVFTAVRSVAPLLKTLKKEGYKVQLINSKTCKF